MGIAHDIRSVIALKVMSLAISIAPNDEKGSVALAVNGHANRMIDDGPPPNWRADGSVPGGGPKVQDRPCF